MNEASTLDKSYIKKQLDDGKQIYLINFPYNTLSLVNISQAVRDVLNKEQQKFNAFNQLWFMSLVDADSETIFYIINYIGNQFTAHIFGNGTQDFFDSFAKHFETLV